MSKAIALDPQDAVAYNQRGIASFAAGDAQAALQDFSRTIELQPQLAEAYNNRGIIQRTLGDYRQASKDFARAAQLGMELAHQHLQVLRDEARQVQERLRSAGYNPGRPMACRVSRRSQPYGNTKKPRDYPSRDS